MILSITRWSLAHKRLVVLLWLVVTAVGFASVSTVTGALSDQYSVPGREGYETNAAITREFGNGGDRAPIVPVVTLPRWDKVDVAGGDPSSSAVTGAIEHALPDARVASYVSTRDRAFVSRDGRTTFAARLSAARAGQLRPNPAAANAVRRRCAASASRARRCTSPGSTRYLLGRKQGRTRAPARVAARRAWRAGARVRLRVAACVRAADCRVDLDHDQLPARVGADDGHLGLGDRRAS